MRICGNTVDLSKTGYPSPSCILEKGHEEAHTDGMGTWADEKPKPSREWVRRDDATTRSEAHFAKEQGWGVGTVLEGAPIVYDGKEIESARILRITAIGEQSVLGRGHIPGSAEWHESVWTFTSRDWRWIS